MDNMNKKLITIAITFIFFTIIFSGCSETDNNSNGNVNGYNTEEFSPFYSKKVLIRDDDIGRSSYWPLVCNGSFRYTR